MLLSHLQMISVSEAKNIILQASMRAEPRHHPLLDAVGLVLAEDVWANQDFPPFAQSAMDGYAIRFEERAELLSVVAEVKAGAAEPGNIGVSKAVRIFTGAPMPMGFDTVVIQEKVDIREGCLHFDEEPQRGSNIRLPGSEIEKGNLAIAAGSVLTASAIGLLASLGKTDVSAYPRPLVSIIVTGNELRAPGSSLQAAEVYESNSFALRAALLSSGIAVTEVLQVRDQLEALTEAVSQCLDRSDLLLITGGMSVGNYDFGPQALERAGAGILFHRIRQKPGKPLLFGKKGGKIIFGMPGNPSSVLTCFYEYVLPCIRQLMGFEHLFLEKALMPAANHFLRKAALVQFLKGRAEDGKVTILDAQESYRMRSFAQANCLVVLDTETGEVHPGDLVEIHKLP